MAADEKAGRGGKARDQGHQGRGAEAEGARSPMGWGWEALFRENLETSDPGLSNQPYLCNDDCKSAPRLLSPIPLPCPSLNLGTDLHLRSIPERTGQNLDPTP